MSKDKSQFTPKQVETDSKSVLEDIFRKGARRCLAAALEAEVDEFMNNMSSKRDENGHCLAVRNGYHKERPIMTAMGPVNIKQPRVDDRNVQKRYPHIKFQSDILPKYMRRVPSLDTLIPVLYLKGVSTQDFPEALAAILGDSAKNLSANTIVRLKQAWIKEYNE
jgi:transposase-like protein